VRSQDQRSVQLKELTDDSAAIFADFSGLLLEKSAKTTRQPMPSAAPIRIWTPPVLQAIYYLRL